MVVTREASFYTTHGWDDKNSINMRGSELMGEGGRVFRPRQTGKTKGLWCGIPPPPPPPSVWQTGGVSSSGTSPKHQQSAAWSQIFSAEVQMRRGSGCIRVSVDVSAPSCLCVCLHSIRKSV